jgi:hypothetical protein
MISFVEHTMLGRVYSRQYMYVTDVNRNVIPLEGAYFTSALTTTLSDGYLWGDIDLSGSIANSDVLDLLKHNINLRVIQPVDIDGNTDPKGQHYLEAMQVAGATYDWPSSADDVTGASPVDLSYIKNTLGVSGEIEFAKFYSGHNSSYDTIVNSVAGSLAAFPSTSASEELSLRHFYGKLADSGLTYLVNDGQFSGSVSLNLVSTITSDTTWSPTTAGTYVFLIFDGGSSGSIKQDPSSPSYTNCGGRAGSIKVAFSKLTTNLTFTVTIGTGGAGVSSDTHGSVEGNKGLISSIEIANSVETGIDYLAGMQFARHYGVEGGTSSSSTYNGTYYAGAKGEGVTVTNGVANAFFSGVNGSYGDGSEGKVYVNATPISVSTDAGQNGAVKIYKVV